MHNKLHIGKGFDLPLELVTSTQAILARKRSGKSYTASVEAEELLEKKQQVVVFDPTSAWHGLRSTADGQGEGYAIVVFGGDHSDAPLDFRSGRALASAVVEHGFSAIFDIGNLHTDEQVQFVMDFSSELLRINRTAIHVFMDEADTFAPQKPLGLLQNKCLGTVSRLVKQGGIRGIGFTMITQRPASMNKDVLSQVDILTVLRMSHPLDIKAATDWIKSEVSLEFARDVEKNLPSLPVGTAFFCSASLGLGERVEVRSRRTFNSGATPKPGERKIEPRVMAMVDISKLGKEISASVQRSKEESVDYLKQRIAKLEAAKTLATPSITPERERMLLNQISELQKTAGAYEKAMHTIYSNAATMQSAAGKIKETIDELRNQPASVSPTMVFASPPIEHFAKVPRMPRSLLVSESNAPMEAITGNVNHAKQRILDAIATLTAMQPGAITIEWIAATAGTTARSRGFEENIRQLRAGGLVEGIRLTATGALLARMDATPATFFAVLDRLATMLSTPQRQILQALKGENMTPEELASELGTTPRSRGFEENVRQLKSRKYIEFGSGIYRLVQWLQELA